MARERSSCSSGSSSDPSAVIDDKILLKFYQKKFEEHQREEDDYRKKLDKHLKNLVSDRHELEEELLRRGEKISDLQKALVEFQVIIFQERERFLKVSAENEELKRKEEQLHADMRHLLSITEHKDLRDQIIYILNDPKVEVGYQGYFPRKLKSDGSNQSVNTKLKKEIDYLQNQVDELLKVSKTKSAVVLEDCKESLERCREKILMDETKIKELQKRLYELTTEKRHHSQQFSPTLIEKHTATSSISFPDSRYFRHRSDSQLFTSQRNAGTMSSFDKKDKSQQFKPSTNEQLTTTSTRFGKKTFGHQFGPITAEKLTATSTGFGKKDVGHQFNPSTAEKVTTTSTGFGKRDAGHQFNTSTAEKVTATSTGFGRRDVGHQFNPSTTDKFTATSAGFGRRDFGHQVNPSTSEKLTATSTSLRRRDVGHQFSPSTAEKITATSAGFGKREIGHQFRTKKTEKLTGTSASLGRKERDQQIGLSTAEKFTTMSSVFDSQYYSTNQRDAATSTKSLSSENMDLTSLSASSKTVSSHLKDLHLSLILLLKVVSKINSILNSIQATKIYQRIADIPRTPTAMPGHVEDSSINQLETYLRQCTRLTYDINNMYKTLFKFVSKNKSRISNSNALEAELTHFEAMLEELTINTTEMDLLNMNLRRSDFFPVMKGTIVCDDVEENLNDFQKIISICDLLMRTVSKTVDFVENIIHTYQSAVNLQVLNQESQFGAPSASLEYQRDSFRGIPPRKTVSDPLPTTKPNPSKDLENLLGIYQRTVQEAESLGLGLSEDVKLLSDRLEATEKRLQEEREKLKQCDDYYTDDEMQDIFLAEPKPPNSDEIIRKIDKTLFKVQQMEKGEFFKEDAMCRKLAENVHELTRKFQELTEEFNMKSVQEQFSEYSKLTLSKLEGLAKNCRNSVVAAEAQIAAHRSNAQNLSEKLRETEELLRESINECLSLKQKVKQVEELRETDKYIFVSELRDRISSNRISNDQDIEEVLNDLIQSVSSKKVSEATQPYACVYCQQGMGHKLCDEKIRELRAKERKSNTLLKLFQQEMKEEKASLKQYREVTEQTSSELSGQNKTLKETIQTLEKKIASLLEQLKVEKNRVKNMERFRRLEIAGFQTDIKNLKEKIKYIEKQLLKAVLAFEKDNKDMELLKTVHEFARTSKDTAALVRRLKAKLYEVENDMKCL